MGTKLMRVLLMLMLGIVVVGRGVCMMLLMLLLLLGPAEGLSGCDSLEGYVYLNLVSFTPWNAKEALALPYLTTKLVDRDLGGGGEK